MLARIEVNKVLDVKSFLLLDEKDRLLRPKKKIDVFLDVSEIHQDS